MIGLDDGGDFGFDFPQDVVHPLDKRPGVTT